MIDCIGDLYSRINRIALFRTDVVDAGLMNSTTLLFPGFLGVCLPTGRSKVWEMWMMIRKMGLIWQHTSGVVAVWLMNGLTIVPVRFSVIGSSELDVKKVGDVDSDTKTDILWRNQITGVVVI